MFAAFCTFGLSAKFCRSTITRQHRAAFTAAFNFFTFESGSSFAIALKSDSSTTAQPVPSEKSVTIRVALDCEITPAATRELVNGAEDANATRRPPSSVPPPQAARITVKAIARNCRLNSNRKLGSPQLSALIGY
jgi:hypothetical protein